MRTGSYTVPMKTLESLVKHHDASSNLVAFHKRIAKRKALEGLTYRDASEIQRRMHRNKLITRNLLKKTEA